MIIPMGYQKYPKTINVENNLITLGYYIIFNYELLYSISQMLHQPLSNFIIKFL